ncbi:hypothetical protein AB1Y20_000473 [Prymnesium parvum]|uniref:Uncharacterized protein n=1 Tax=Prymnesium parvum TaxID=97485 RepID=A0AB34K8J0_PRYPA
MSEARRHKEALLQQLPEPERSTYWEAFSQYLRFELSHAEFDAAARTALGPLVSSHNEFVWRMLQAASCTDAAAAEEADGAMSYAPRPMFVNPPKRLRSELCAESAPPSAEPSAADGVCFSSQRGGEAAGGALLPLKITKDAAGIFTSSTAVPAPLEVNPAEEAQLNSLQHRLCDLAKLHGIARVQPEAVSLMQMAVKAHVHRLIAGGVRVKRCKPGVGAHAESKKLGEAHLAAAMRHYTPATWMVPPCLRVDPSLQKFVS